MAAKMGRNPAVLVARVTRERAASQVKTISQLCYLIIQLKLQYLDADFYFSHPTNHSMATGKAERS